MQNRSEGDFRGAHPAIVEHFSIEGLYGYRTLSLYSKYAATILIAKNGAGKTTLLGALDAFLKGQFSRLNSLKFETISCRLRGVEKTLTVSQDQVFQLSKTPENRKLYELASKISVEPTVLFDFIDNEYSTLKRNMHGTSYGENPIYDKIVSAHGYSGPDAELAINSLAKSLESNNPEIAELRNVLKTQLRGIDIVYLPTYRRIELPLTSEEESRTQYPRKKSVQDRLGISKKSVFAGEIQFGLGDISERLAALNQEILFNSNQGYREISASIINELISGAYDEIPSVQDRPDKESLSLFFSRLKEGRRIGPFGDVTIPDIDKIYTGLDISSESNKFLTYFLGKLNTVIRATKDIESLVEDFVKNCNRYLSQQDGSADVRAPDQTSTRGPSADDKVLQLDRKNLQVKVRSIAGKRRILLDSLSSGEKQMISLFARLYLYPEKKIVLIDEPELSLSLDWQKKILVDVVSAPSCVQTIAITHSPFVFDNELEPYARPLSLKIDSNANELNVDPEDEFDD